MFDINLKLLEIKLIVVYKNNVTKELQLEQNTIFENIDQKFMYFCS